MNQSKLLLLVKRCFVHLILLVVVIFQLIACKKDREVAESYIYYEVNGIPYSKTSKTELTFQFGGMYIQTTGEEKPTPILYVNSPVLNITVQDYSEPIQPGTYSGKTWYSNGWTKEVRLSYKHTNNEIYQQNYNNPVALVHITSISREGATGTFNGKVELNTSEGLDTLRITNGEFSIYTYKN
jgi:hypothetical protein